MMREVFHQPNGEITTSCTRLYVHTLDPDFQQRHQEKASHHREAIEDKVGLGWAQFVLELIQPHEQEGPRCQ